MMTTPRLLRESRNPEDDTVSIWARARWGRRLPRLTGALGGGDGRDEGCGHEHRDHRHHGTTLALAGGEGGTHPDRGAREGVDGQKAAEDVEAGLVGLLVPGPSRDVRRKGD